jgi:endogenous inhibitor of DNA gyrase (YacG/DUF329 family)
MNVCDQVTVECRECGHAFVAVPGAETRCAQCGAEYDWEEREQALRP